MSAILIVEDDHSIRELIKSIVRQDGHDVFEAEDGVEALSHMHASSIDLVITDLMMPAMGGVELMRNIRAKHSASLPMIVISAASVSVSVCQELHALNMRSFFTKPFSVERLLKAVRSAIRETCVA